MLIERLRVEHVTCRLGRERNWKGEKFRGSTLFQFPWLNINMKSCIT